MCVINRYYYNYGFLNAYVTTLPSYPLYSIPLIHEPNPNYWPIRYAPRRLLSSLQPNNNNNIDEQKTRNGGSPMPCLSLSEAFSLWPNMLDETVCGWYLIWSQRLPSLRHDTHSAITDKQSGWYKMLLSCVRASSRGLNALCPREGGLGSSEYIVGSHDRFNWSICM